MIKLEEKFLYKPSDEDPRCMKNEKSFFGIDEKYISNEEILNGSVIIDNSEVYEIERLKKLEKFIEILKDKFYLRVHNNMFGSWLFIKEKTKHGEVVSCALDLDIVDTIKEVLENE